MNRFWYSITINNCKRINDPGLTYVKYYFVSVTWNCVDHLITTLIVKCQHLGEVWQYCSLYRFSSSILTPYITRFICHAQVLVLSGPLLVVEVCFLMCTVDPNCATYIRRRFLGGSMHRKYEPGFPARIRWMRRTHRTSSVRSQRLSVGCGASMTRTARWRLSHPQSWIGTLKSTGKSWFARTEWISATRRSSRWDIVWTSSWRRMATRCE